MARALTIGAVVGFNPTLRNIDLSGIPAFDIRRLLKVTNEKSNTPIYLKDAPGRGYTAVSGAVVTLAYDTSAMGAGDLLSVIYDSPANQGTSYFSEGINQSVAANAAVGGLTGRDAGPSPSAYTKINAYFFSNQSGTATILGSDDGSAFLSVYNQPMAANTIYTTSQPILFRYYYIKYVNGGTSASATVKGSFSVS